MNLKTFRMLTKDLDDREEITESLLSELEEELVKPTWARGKTLWASCSDDYFYLSWLRITGVPYSYNDSIDSWRDPFSKSRQYIRNKNGKVILSYDGVPSEILTDPDFDFENRLK